MSAPRMSSFHKSVVKTFKGKAFSSKGKIERYNNDGTETIIVMGRPFRVLQKISEGSNPASNHAEGGGSKGAKEFRSYVFLVENTEDLKEFPRHLALKRSFFNVDEVVMAHIEPEVLGRVKDKGIVRVFHSEVTRNDGRLGVTVAMEYCSSNLQRRLRQETRMSESEIVQVLIAITSAVGYLHSQQPPIAHRNICPENILIQSNAVGALAYRLCNFSSAAVEAYECENSDEVRMAVDDFERHTTLGFRAPEMEDPVSRKRIDERVDLWSIGVLLYYMMYMQLPFGEMNIKMTRQLNLRFPSGTEMWYTGSLHVVLQHLLVADPDKRWDIFALTNFLRFDEDISKHLGTFFFTATEWPDGWEQQEVKVVNRPVPRKAPPIQVEEKRRVVAARNCTAEGKSEVDAGYKVSPPMRLGELDVEALTALGLDMASDDQDMIAYREMLIREQEEAWSRATAAKQAERQIAVGETATTSVAAEVQKDKQQQQQQQQYSEEQKTEKPNTIFDDLFDTAQVPSVVVPHTTAPPVASAPACSQPNTQLLGSSTITNNDKSWQDSLFNTAPPQQLGEMTMLNDGWGTGAPTGMPAMATTGSVCGTGGMCGTPKIPMMQPLYAQQQQQQQWQAPLPMKGGLAPVEQPSTQQATFNFVGGSLPPASTPTLSQPVEEKKKKDPFEDLFR